MDKLTIISFLYIIIVSPYNIKSQIIVTKHKYNKRQKTKSFTVEFMQVIT